MASITGSKFAVEYTTQTVAVGSKKLAVIELGAPMGVLEEIQVNGVSLLQANECNIWILNSETITPITFDKAAQWTDQEGDGNLTDWMVTRNDQSIGFADFTNKRNLYVLIENKTGNAATSVFKIRVFGIMYSGKIDQQEEPAP